MNTISAESRHDRRGLDWIVAPMSVDEFDTSFWGRYPLRVARQDPKYFAGVPSLRDVDGLITTTVVDVDAKHGKLVRVGTGGEFSERPFRPTEDGRVDIQDIYRAYSDGYTVVLNLLELRSPYVAKICRALESDLGYRVGANFYLTPPGAQGFAAHYDSHDVMVVQIHGEKRWRVGDSPYPDVSGPGNAMEDFAERSLDWTLTAGDTMYLPKGCPHQAVTGDCSSLHITFGLATLSWSDLGVAPGVVESEEGGLRFDSLLKPLSGRLDESDPDAVAAIEEARRSFVSVHMRRYMARGGHFASLDVLDKLTSGATVARAVGGPAHFDETSSGTILQYPGGRAELPNLPASTVEFLGTAVTFRVGELPGFVSDEERVYCVAQFVRAGFLCVTFLD